jgi:sugar O-acyltransferase (sialic acid O-acetyltransferase NeuD family)
VTRDIAIVGLEWDVVDLAESCADVHLIGFLDSNPGAQVRDLAYLGSDDDWQRVRASMPYLRVVLSMDDANVRARLFDYYSPSALASLISPSAHVSRRATVGAAAIVQRGAVVMPYAQLGRSCKLNVGAVVHHESQLGDFVTLAPGATVLGRVVIEDRVYIGAGAIIRQRCRIGRGAFVGAGAVVVRDVDPEATVIGVPARRRVA